MSTDTTTAEPAEEVKPEEARPEHTRVHLSYGGLSSIVPDDGVNRLALFTHLQRDPVGVDWKAFALDGTPAYGTTNIDFSQTLYQAIQQLRSYRPTRLSLGKEQPKVLPVPGGERLNKNVNIPDSWLRGFLQVQSAATFP